MGKSTFHIYNKIPRVYKYKPPSQDHMDKSIGFHKQLQLQLIYLYILKTMQS